MNFKPPKASEVIEVLQTLINKHGDLPVCADDPDTGFRMQIGIVHKPEDIDEEWPERFEIKTDYNSEPRGLILHSAKEYLKKNIIE
jgi:hypothetical protein